MKSTLFHYNLYDYDYNIKYLITMINYIIYFFYNNNNNNIFRPQRTVSGGRMT